MNDEEFEAELNRQKERQRKISEDTARHLEELRKKKGSRYDETTDEDDGYHD